MPNFTISIFENQIFFEIIKEIKYFSKFIINHYSDLNLCINDAYKKNLLVIFFISKKNKRIFDQSKTSNFPLILISEHSESYNISCNELQEHIYMPFNILELEKKVISLIAKNEFRKNSLIKLNDYIIDKNERKIRKDNLEVKLSEREINFLILFSRKKNPISINLVLKNVWNYSSKSETHTVETHIHKLRKKILEKFGDSNFIKNNKKGYYI